MKQKRPTRRAIEKALRNWCRAVGCDWGEASLQEGAAYEEHRKMLKASLTGMRTSGTNRKVAFVLSIDGSELYDVFWPCKEGYDDLNTSLDSLLNGMGLYYDLHDGETVILIWDDEWEPFHVELG